MMVQIVFTFFFQVVSGVVPPKFEKGQRKFLFDGSNFFVQTSETRQIYPKTFPPQNEPHTAKLRFSFLFKHFRRNWLKILFWLKILTISERC